LFPFFDSLLKADTHVVPHKVALSSGPSEPAKMHGRQLDLLPHLYYRTDAMPTRTFPALVKDGQLSFGESLADLEGQHVVVTLAPTAARQDADRPGVLPAPDWLDIESNDVFRLPYQWDPIHVDVIDAGRIHPAIVLPQEMPDE
jgi:hypothetical protein